MDLTLETQLDAIRDAMREPVLSAEEQMERRLDSIVRDLDEIIAFGREAMLTYGAITPRSLRSGLKMYADRLPELICAWRQRHGLPVETTTIEPFGRQVEGVRYSAF